MDDTTRALLAECADYIADLLGHAPLGGADRTRYGPDIIRRIVNLTGTPVEVPGEASDRQDRRYTIGPQPGRQP